MENVTRWRIRASACPVSLIRFVITHWIARYLCRNCLFWIDYVGKNGGGLQALVNVGADLTKLVPGRVSTEVDARLAYDTHGILKRVLRFHTVLMHLMFLT